MDLLETLVAENATAQHFAAVFSLRLVPIRLKPFYLLVYIVYGDAASWRERRYSSHGCVEVSEVGVPSGLW